MTCIVTKTEFIPITESQAITTEKTLDILFNNLASGTIYINNFPVAQSASLSITCNGGECLKDQFNIKFPSGVTGTVNVFKRVAC